MYAVIASGGKQYRVKQDQFIIVEKLEVAPGVEIEFSEVLLVADGKELRVGAPHLAGCKVTAVVEKHQRAKKIKILKFKRRKHHMKRMGHRQWQTTLKITSIKTDDAA